MANITNWLFVRLRIIVLRKPAIRVKVMVVVVVVAVKEVVSSDKEVEAVMLTWPALTAKVNLKLRVMVKAGLVVRLPRRINAIIVTNLELTILISVIARFAYAAIVIRMTIRMVFTVRVIP